MRFTTKFERVENCNDAETSRTGSAQFCRGCIGFGSRGRVFYDRLFDIAPQMKAMFPGDMIEQHRKLMAMLAGVVKGLGNLE